MGNEVRLDPNRIRLSDLGKEFGTSDKVDGARTDGGVVLYDGGGSAQRDQPLQSTPQTQEIAKSLLFHAIENEFGTDAAARIFSDDHFDLFNSQTEVSGNLIDSIRARLAGGDDGAVAVQHLVSEQDDFESEGPEPQTSLTGTGTQSFSTPAGWDEAEPRFGPAVMQSKPTPGGDTPDPKLQDLQSKLQDKQQQVDAMYTTFDELQDKLAEHRQRQLDRRDQLKAKRQGVGQSQSSSEPDQAELKRQVRNVNRAKAEMYLKSVFDSGRWPSLIDQARDPQDKDLLSGGGFRPESDNPPVTLKGARQAILEAFENQGRVVTSFAKDQSDLDSIAVEALKSYIRFPELPD